MTKDPRVQHLKVSDLQEVDHKEAFARNVRAAVRGLWSGVMDYYDFFDAMASAVRYGITNAWNDGAAECGILPNELSPEEQMARQSMITGQMGYINGFASAIEQNSKANGGLLGPLLTRGEMWSNRYNDAKNQARTMACADKKLKWTLGPTEHCKDCARLAGKVKRGSQWTIRPQSPELECGGFRCQCQLVPTDEPMSKGPLPKI